jgi:serine/threonine protein kinase
MEFCGGGDLFSAIENLRMPTQNWCAGVMKQVLLGVLYLHQQLKESHNDLKPQNILLDRKPGGPQDVPRAMIADFGCLAPIGTIRQSFGGGDPRYRAPETFSDSPFDQKTDCWSIGVTLFELVTGGLMIHTNKPNSSSWQKFSGTSLCEQLMAKLEAGEMVDLSKVPSESQTELHQLLQGLLSVDAAQRLDATAGLEHPWFSLADNMYDFFLPQDVVQSLARRSRSHVLSIALLNVIGSQLQGESINYYRRIWAKYDTNKSGHIEFKEFSVMLDEIKRDPNAANSTLLTVYPTAEALFEFADVSQNGTIDFTEFVGLMFNPDLLTDQERSEYFKRAFHYLAGDDHKITADEFAVLFEQGQECKEVIVKLFNDVDKDGSGYVDYEEFAAYVDEL